MKGLLAMVLFGTVAISSTAFAGDRERREDRREHRVHRETRQEARREAREAAERREAAWIERRRIERARDYRAWEAARELRAREHRQAVAAQWGFVLRTPAGRAELMMHSERMSRLHRLHDIAEARRDRAMIARVDRLIAMENARSIQVLSLMIRMPVR